MKNSKEKGAENNVFISFGERDIEKARYIRQVLENNGISCFFSPDHTADKEEYASLILDAIKSCEVFLLILSSNAQNSNQVKRELEKALEYDKTIFPFTVEDFELNREFNFMLAQTQRVNAFLKKDEAISRLVSEIKEELDQNKRERRRKRVKRLLVTGAVIAAAAAAVLMIVFLLPRLSFPIDDSSEEHAAETAVSAESAAEETALTTVEVSGETGDCIYRYDADKKTLIISGSGKMADYTKLTEVQPWSELLRELEYVVIEDGVTNVGNGAFKHCTQLKEVRLPSGVTSIGVDAFYLCRQLQSINIPDTVKEIKEYAFAGCTSLETVTNISIQRFMADGLFENCSSLKSFDFNGIKRR